MTRWECNACDEHCKLEKDTPEIPDGCPYDEPDGSSWDPVKEAPTMRTDEEVRKRKMVLHETLAGLYGKGMPYAEERLAARIDEDIWFLKERPEEKVPEVSQ